MCGGEVVVVNGVRPPVGASRDQLYIFFIITD